MARKKSSNSRMTAYLYLLIATAIWGAAAPVIKFTFQGIAPFPFLAYRFFIAGIIGLLVIILGNFKIPKAKDLLIICIIYGFLATTLALSVLFIGLEKSTVLDLALIGNSAPLLVMFGGWLFFKDKITNREKTGTLITLIGTAIVILGPILLSSNILKLTGNLFLLLFLFIDSSSVLISKYLVKKKVNPFFLANLAFVIGAITLIPFIFNYYSFDEIKNVIFNLEFKYHLGVFYMAILSGNVAYGALMRGVRSIEVSEAGLFAYLQPLFSTPLAVFWLGEQITIIFIIGAIIIASGVFIAETKPKK